MASCNQYNFYNFIFYIYFKIFYKISLQHLEDIQLVKICLGSEIYLYPIWAILKNIFDDGSLRESSMNAQKLYS